MGLFKQLHESMDSLYGERSQSVVTLIFFRLPYASIFGGVGSFTKEQFENINGFSNKFWGWGGEDDDLYRR